MHIFVVPSKDTTIYNDEPTQNTGKDEILEIIKKPITAASRSLSPSETAYVSASILSRALIQFDLSYISRSIAAGTITAPRFYLNMHVCRVDGQEESSTLYIYPIQTGSSWVQGIGKRWDGVIREEGASWTASDGEVPTYWALSGSNFIDTGSLTATASLWPNQNNFTDSEIYTYELADLRADVSNIVNRWFSGSENNGFLIKRSVSEEEDVKDYGIIQFYSSDTHTVYGPTLEVAWDDSAFATGTLVASNIDDMFIYTKNLKEQYNNREKARIKVGTRELFPSKSYADSNPYLHQKYLPTSSYYSVIDSFTAETIVPFDTGSTKISCDSNGNFFNIWMNGFQPERFYKLRVKVVSGSSENIFDIPTNFKVVR